MTTLRCIVCTEVLKPIWDPVIFPQDAQVNQPSGGMTFTSEGQYGTTVFDPMNGSFLEINICDDCMKMREAEGGFILHGTPRRSRRETRYVKWTMERVDE